MSKTLHITCPHCQAANRLPAERLAEHPNCGRCQAPLFTGQPVELDALRFDKHLAHNALPLVVDFWAPWCAPCRMMAPAFAQAATQFEPGIRLAKVNTEENPALAARFSIRSIPTLIAFRDGREIARQSGALDRAGLQRWLRALG